MKDNECFTLPSGTQVIRSFDRSGILVNEIWSNERLSIDMSFRDGRKTSESYFYKDRLVGRKKYERERVNYPDMPAPDESLRDWGAAALRDLAQERREHARAAESHIEDPTKARQLDDFCIRISNEGRTENAHDWLKSSSHTLGDMTPAVSRRLVEKLLRLGATDIRACKIDSYANGTENTGHLVLELPADATRRAGLLKEIDRLARKQGYEGAMDDGQRYAYLKLD